MSSRGRAERGPVLYVLKRYPRLSETFILRELLTLESLGEAIVVDSLLPPEDGVRHRDVDRIKAEVRYLPRRPRLSDGPVLRAHLALAVRRPRRWLVEARRARRADAWRRFLQAGLVADRARRLRARHIHAHFLTAAAEVARQAGLLTNLPVSVTAHAKDIFQKDNAALVRSRSEGIATLVTVSEYNTRHLRRTVNGTSVVHVPNGVPAGPTSDPEAGAPMLCVARLVPKKGIDVLLDAVALLRAPVTELQLEIIGDGPLRASLEQQAVDLGIAERVRFLGAQGSEQVEAALARCSMVVLACRVAEDGDQDGMPTVLVEALARGRPVIATAIGGIQELVRPGDTGLLVRPQDPRALADAIQQLHGDPALARALGRAGRKLVAERFDPQRSARLLQDVFAGAAR